MGYHLTHLTHCRSLPAPDQVPRYSCTMPYRREGVTTASKMLGPADGGKPRRLVLDRRLTRSTTEAIANALEQLGLQG